MNDQANDYQPLLSVEGSPESACGCKTCGKNLSLLTRARFRETLYLLVISLQALGLLIFVFSISRRPSVNVSAELQHPKLYSPAHHLDVEGQIKVFADNFAVTTVYQEYSDASDQAWQDLYNRTMMKIPKSEAALLPNKTWPIKDSPGFYIAQLDVFHQLHCLVGLDSLNHAQQLTRELSQNKVRQALRPERYSSILNVTLELSDFHIAHCVDSIRQYVMCHADTAVVPWQWSDESGGVGPRLDYPHMCKNFDQIREWSQQRYIDHYINATEYVEDDLPVPPIIY